jgi:hypothetical protein
MDNTQNQLLESQIEWQLQSIQELQEAMRMIEELQEKIDNALQYNEDECHYKAYGRYGIDQLIGNGNRYDGSIPKLIERAEKQIEYYKSQVV